MKILSTLLLVASLVLLYFGITEPIISIKLSYFLDAGIKTFEGNIFDTTRSIIETSKRLIHHEKFLVGFLILTFSCIIPALKTLLITLTYFNIKNKILLRKIASIISKWSMADVFVVAIFLVFMATDGVREVEKENFSIMGFSLNILVKVTMESSLKNGFYYFLSYCLLSIFHAGLLKRSSVKI